jgi:hypothetical protein
MSLVRRAISGGEPVQPQVEVALVSPVQWGLRRYLTDKAPLLPS